MAIGKDFRFIGLCLISVGTGSFIAVLAMLGFQQGWWGRPAIFAASQPGPTGQAVEETVNFEVPLPAHSAEIPIDNINSEPNMEAARPAVAPTIAYVIQYFKPFEIDSSTDDIWQVEQSLLVQRSQPDTVYGIGLTYDDGIGETSLGLDLYVSNQGTVGAQFRIEPASDTQLREQVGIDCKTSNTRHGCRVQYSWDENIWYRFRLAKMKSDDEFGTRWSAWISDVNSGIETHIGVIRSRRDVPTWVNPKIGIANWSHWTMAECQSGLPSMKATFLKPVLNNGAYNLTAQSAVPNPCAENNGGGWNAEEKTTGSGNNTFTLMIGQ